MSVEDKVLCSCLCDISFYNKSFIKYRLRCQSIIEQICENSIAKISLHTDQVIYNNNKIEQGQFNDFGSDEILYGIRIDLRTGLKNFMKSFIKNIHENFFFKII